jgi:hypothetical protein
MKRRSSICGHRTRVVLLPCTALAFDSGSTGADGDFNPPVSVEVPLPPNGILNYRSVNIPLGVTVRFKRNDDEHSGDDSRRRGCSDLLEPSTWMERPRQRLVLFLATTIRWTTGYQEKGDRVGSMADSEGFQPIL